MQRNRGRSSVYKAVILQLVLLTVIALKYGHIAHPGWYKLLYLTIPLLVTANLYPQWKGIQLPWLKRLKLSTLNRENMATVLVAVIAAIIPTRSCRLFETIYQKEKRKRMNRILQQFNELGSSNNLTFSSQEILHDCIIGLDGVNRKILIAKSIEDVISHTELIELSDIKSCSVIKHFGNIKGGELKVKKLETYLELIALHFERVHSQPPVDIPFYKHRKNSLHELEKLEKKARHWEIVLSKMIHVPVKKIA